MNDVQALAATIAIIILLLVILACYVATLVINRLYQESGRIDRLVQEMNQVRASLLSISYKPQEPEPKKPNTRTFWDPPLKGN